MRLDKYLADCGVGTRSQVKKKLRDGAVQVEGVAQPRPETPVEPETARVWVEGSPVQYRRFVYLMLNKPQGCLSATRDSRQPTVLDLVPEAFRHWELFPVGRLDRDTEGLCLLTNDGQLAHRLLSPAHHVPKTYEARVEGLVTQADIDAFRQGLTLTDGARTRPAALEITEAGPVSGVRVTITQGMYHQIKRMFGAVGKRVVYLKRISMGGLALDPALPPGAVRELTPQELRRLEEV